MNATNTRTIHTGLYGTQAKAVIDGVHGQLSDGKWENSPGHDKYWINFDVQTADDGEVIFKVNAESYTMWCKLFMSNPFYKMSDAAFKKWIATKIKAVVNDERKDREEFGEWDRKNIDHTTLYLGKYDEVLHDIVTTVADVYCTYEALLGREIGITKYDSSTICRVFGTKRTDEEIAKVKSAREHKDAIYAKYKTQIDSLKESTQMTIQKLQEKLKADIDALLAAQKAELEKVDKA